MYESGVDLERCLVKIDKFQLSMRLIMLESTNVDQPKNATTSKELRRGQIHYSIKSNSEIEKTPNISPYKEQQQNILCNNVGTDSDSYIEGRSYIENDNYSERDINMLSSLMERSSVVEKHLGPTRGHREFLSTSFKQKSKRILQAI